MKLVPIAAQYLRLNESLPFGLRDANGRLLLAADIVIADRYLLDDMLAQTLYADEIECLPWQRRLNAAMDAALRNGAALGDVAAVRPEAAREAPTVQLTLGQEWDELVSHLDTALRDVKPGSDWRARLFGVHARARGLMQRKPDASLYHLVYEAGQSMAKYSSHHALMTMLMGEQAATTLGWEQPWIDALGRAALTMNVSMLRLQDQLALRESPLTAQNRASVESHPADGAKLLQESGLGDALAIEVVRLHHDTGDGDAPMASLPPERQLARLLRRVDLFAAKISRRAARAPMSPVQAAREACLGAGGVPDEVGGALLRAVGLYPPGSFVQLANGEQGIVLARGRRANLPFVATLISASGNILGEPALRDTIDQRYAVKSALAPGVVKVRPPHERLLAMR